MSSDSYARYLRLLGIDGTPSGLDGLRTIVRRHLSRVPFENVSKLLLFAREGAGRRFTLTEFLDGIEYQDLGGTCYNANPHLIGLLRHLGYEADLLAADMHVPNCHTCIRVRMDGVAYHVDCGYGGPFREPMRLDRIPHDFREGGLRYLFDHNAHPGAFEMKVLSGEQRVHGYIVHEPPQTPDFFDPALQNSFLPDRTFMTHLRIVKIFEEHSIELFDGKLTIHRSGQTQVRELGTFAELKAVLANDLAMPKCPIEEIVGQVADLPKP